MEVKQSKVAAFFIDNANLDESLAYIEKNAPLLKSYLLIFSHPVQEALSERCEAWGLVYVHNQGQLKNKPPKDQKNTNPKSQEAVKPVDTKDQATVKSEILRNIRSGETIACKGDLLISGNINDGAMISSEGTMAIFGIISGDISCNGSYLIVSEFHRGKVIFQGEVINDMITGKQLKMFYKEDDKIKIKELT